MSNLIRQKVILALETTRFEQAPVARKFALYLPEGERQELSLLFMHFLAKKHHHRSVYLGLDMSLSDLADTWRILRPDYFFTIITETMGSGLEDYLAAFQQNFPDAHLLLSGYQAMAQQIKSGPRLTVLPNLGDTTAFLSSLAPMPPRNIERRSSSQR